MVDETCKFGLHQAADTRIALAATSAATRAETMAVVTEADGVGGCIATPAAEVWAIPASTATSVVAA